MSIIFVTDDLSAWIKGYVWKGNMSVEVSKRHFGEIICRHGLRGGLRPSAEISRRFIGPFLEDLWDKYWIGLLG